MSKREVFEVSNELILKNQRIMNEVRLRNQNRIDDLERPLRATIITFGCQMNEHDSEKLAAMLRQMGYELTEDKDNTDFVIFNTCCVRENAELRVFGNLGQMKTMKKKNPELMVAVCGCMMQQPHIVDEIKAKYRHVDLVFGTHNIHNFPTLLAEAYDAAGTVVEVWDHEGEVIEGLDADRKYGLKAFVNIMYGCNNFCTYCIVPYTRGRERSREPGVIVEEIKDLVANGTREVTLLGQNVNSYGKTLDTTTSFAQLIRMINEVDGLDRIRFMTSHPKDISDELIDAMADCDKVCEHIHLPVQAGDDGLLKRMNRKYDRQHYFDIVDKLKSKMPSLAITTDLIVGFPGETDEEFQGTMDLVEKVRYSGSYTFIYSVRKGTPAAEMDDQIPEDVKHERFDQLLSSINRIVRENNDHKVGEVMEVLVEGASKKDSGVLMGKSRCHRTVNFATDQDLVGKLVTVKITQALGHSLRGDLVEILG